MKVVAAVAMPPAAIGEGTVTSSHIYAFRDDGSVFRRAQKGGDWERIEPVPGTPAAAGHD